MSKCRPSSALSNVLLALAVSGCATSGRATLAPPEPAAAPRPDTPAARGAWVFSTAGCTLCHGQGGKGGVNNRNSETGGKINGLTVVKEAYSAKELAQKIREGVREVGRANKHGPVPPLRMPAYGTWLSDQAIDDLVAYLFSIYPKGAAKKGDSWDNDSDEDSDEDAAKPAAKPKKDATPKSEGKSKDDDDSGDDDDDQPAREKKPVP